MEQTASEEELWKIIKYYDTTWSAMLKKINMFIGIASSVGRSYGLKTDRVM